MITKTCKTCDNRICKDMIPTMQKQYVALCLNSNRSRFIQHKDKEIKNGSNYIRHREQ